MRLEWLRRLFRRGRLDADLEDEIRFHLAQEAQLRLDRGEALERAQVAAQRDFGNVLLMKETTRDMWGGRWLDDFARDARYALRGIKRSPALATVAILSLALGIGANTAIFSLADAVLFRPLPVREPERLMQLRAVHAGGVRQTFSFPLYRDFRDLQSRIRVHGGGDGRHDWRAGLSRDRRHVAPYTGPHDCRHGELLLDAGRRNRSRSSVYARRRPDARRPSGGRHQPSVLETRARERRRGSRSAPSPQRHFLRDRRGREGGVHRDLVQRRSRRVGAHGDGRGRHAPPGRARCARLIVAVPLRTAQGGSRAGRCLRRHCARVCRCATDTPGGEQTAR